MNIFIPKFFTLLKNGFSKKQITKDITSGIIVGIIALPLAIAFAIASGVSPEKGIITAILSGFIISFLGGSRVQIGGPTGAFIIIVYAILAKHGLNGLLIATFMAGILLVIMGLLKMGSFLKYIPQTLIIGFTAGIAVIIFTTQIKDFFGLQIEHLPANFFLKWGTYFKNLKSLNFWSVIIGAGTILMCAGLPKLTNKIPWTLIALITASALVYFLKLPVETIFTKFGNLSSSFPQPAFFKLDITTIKELITPAFSIALLGALESLLSAVVADSMIGGKHRSNTELIAQGIANMVTPIFGGIPATGAIARTATNIKSGGRTPIAGIVHAITLLIIFFIAMPIVKYIPLAALSGILIIVAWQMSEIKTFIKTCTINLYETLVLITTFLLTVFTDLTIAIPIGFLLSVLLFMKRMSDSVDVSPLLFSKTDEETTFNDEIGTYSSKIAIFELNGPLFFGSVHHFINIQANLDKKHSVAILRFRYVPIIDSTGLSRLREIKKALDKNNIKLIISAANSRVSEKLIKQGLIKKEEIKPNIKEALIEAERIK